MISDYCKEEEEEEEEEDWWDVVWQLPVLKVTGTEEASLPA